MRSFAAQGVAVFAMATLLLVAFFVVLFTFGAPNGDASVIVCDGRWPQWVLRTGIPQGIVDPGSRDAS